MNTGLNRIGDECFYTKKEVSKKLVSKLQELVDIQTFDKVIEPSAGDGSFIKALEELGITNIISYDINPKSKNIILQDFLKLDTSIFKDKILVVGNPPFGKNSCLAIKFIKKISEFATVFALVLPKSFKKNSRISLIPELYHCIYIEDLPKHSFIIENNSVDVNCSFFVYKKLTYPREKYTKKIPNDKYVIIKKDQIEKYKNVIAFRRVGANAGKFYKDNIKNLSEESHYFINLLEDIDITKCVFDIENNTVGPKSISKSELIEQLNKC